MVKLDFQPTSYTAAYGKYLFHIDRTWKGWRGQIQIKDENIYIGKEMFSKTFEQAVKKLESKIRENKEDKAVHTGGLANIEPIVRY